jgi:hypothetical protein
MEAPTPRSLLFLEPRRGVGLDDPEGSIWRVCELGLVRQEAEGWEGRR